VTDQPPAGPGSIVRQLAPVLTAAGMFTVSDVFAKLALNGGTNVLTLLSSRSIVGIVLMFLWLRLRPPVALTPRMKWVSLGLGVLFTLNLFGVFKAIELVPVSIAILIYFIYPLLTGIIGAATGLDRLSLSGVVTAIVAFFGLTLIIGANPVDLAALGIVAAVGGALARTAMLLVTRAELKGADAGLVTWYTLWSSTAIFVVAAALAWDWQLPHVTSGWIAFVGIGFSTVAAILAIYVSTQRIGPFRTALYMNLEPFMTAVVSAVVIGDRLTAVQILGGAIMIAALFVFQVRR
jgi:drug/metabolite transporter (DMT)-like permease